MTSKKSAPAKHESSALSLAQLKTASAGSALMQSSSAFFTDASEFSLPEGAKIKAMSPLMKPVDFPEGKVLVGRFAKIFETSPQKGKKGEGVEIVPDGSAVGIALPAVATLRIALEITGEGASATSPHLGKLVAVQKMPGKLKSKKGQDAWHFVVAILPDPAN